MPQFLFRPWCTREESGAERLWACRRLPTGELHHARFSPRSAGYVTDLYKLRSPFAGVDFGASNRPYEVEEAYSRLESAAAPIRDRMLLGAAPSELSAAERQAWAEFIGTLEHRSPRQLRVAEAVGMGVLEELRQEHRERFDDPDGAFAQLDLDAVVGNAARTTTLLNRDRLAAPINDWQWYCVKHDELGLITADYPIANLLHEGDSIALYLPLSPSTLFIAASAPIGRDEGAMAALSSNLLLIHQKPNFIYSKDRLADGEVFRLLKAAGDTLDLPEDL